MCNFELNFLFLIILFLPGGLILSFKLKFWDAIKLKEKPLIGSILVGQRARRSVRLRLLLKVKATETHGTQRSPSSWCTLGMFRRVRRRWTRDTRMWASWCRIYGFEGRCRLRGQWMLGQTFLCHFSCFTILNGNKLIFLVECIFLLCVLHNRYLRRYDAPRPR